MEKAQKTKGSFAIGQEQGSFTVEKEKRVYFVSKEQKSKIKNIVKIVMCAVIATALTLVFFLWKDPINLVKRGIEFSLSIVMSMMLVTLLENFVCEIADTIVGKINDRRLEKEGLENDARLTDVNTQQPIDKENMPKK